MTNAGNTSGQEPKIANTFKLTFNIETLRMMAYLTLVLMVGTGIVVTKLFVHIPEDQTVIYEIFGFNHICNVFDHPPSREVSALLVLFFSLPMGAFVLCSYYRTYDAFKEKRVPAWLQSYNKIITPFCFLAACYTYMWFVNAPDTKEQFLGHYLPYVALQLAFGLLAIQEVAYLIYHGALPFGASVGVAKAYLAVLITLTVACHAAAFSLLLGYPILDSPNNHNAAIAFQVLMYAYSFVAIVVPIFLSARNRKNGLVSTISFG